MIPKLLTEPIVKSRISNAKGKLLIPIPEWIIKVPDSRKTRRFKVAMTNSQSDKQAQSSKFLQLLTASLQACRFFRFTELGGKLGKPAIKIIVK